MSPSATETTTTVVENIKSALKPSNEDENGKGNVDSADNDGLPKLEVNHREPLKLSGALDQFKTFDVTPVIGREFVDADLAEWLRAPNSDELIRDLGITSKYCLNFGLIMHFCPCTGKRQPKLTWLPSCQSHREALSSFASRTISPTISRRSSCSVWVN